MSPDRTSIFTEALRLAGARRFAEADTLVRRSVSKPAKDSEGLAFRGRLAIVAGRPGDARSLLEKSIKIEPSHEAFRLLAQYHLLMVENDLAVAATQASIDLDPGNPAPRIEAAAILIELGRVEDAARILARVEESPRLDDTLSRRLQITLASIEIQRSELESAVARLDAVLADDPPRFERHGALDLLAKACDRAGFHDRAFEAAARRNEEADVRLDLAEITRQTTRIIENTDRDSLARWPIGVDDALPVFVAGMPRSGTSLVDRLIDAHPRAAGVGELPLLERFAGRLSKAHRPGPPPACFGEMQEPAWKDGATTALRELRDMGGDADRIVDKSLANDRMLGIASRLLPGSRVIHIIRDPRDVAVSCFLGRFRDDRFPWTTSLEGIASAWRESERIMRHWKSVLDIPILEVRYERLVQDPDREFPRIIEFLGLDWNDACRRFHENASPIRTLSFDQVNRPLYTSSVGRHRHYERHLAGVEWPTYES